MFSPEIEKGKVCILDQIAKFLHDIMDIIYCFLGREGKILDEDVYDI